MLKDKLRNAEFDNEVGKRKILIAENEEGDQYMIIETVWQSIERLEIIKDENVSDNVIDLGGTKTDIVDSDGFEAIQIKNDNEINEVLKNTKSDTSEEYGHYYELIVGYDNFDKNHKLQDYLKRNNFISVWYREVEEYEADLDSIERNEEHDNFEHFFENVGDRFVSYVLPEDDNCLGYIELQGDNRYYWEGKWYVTY